METFDHGLDEFAVRVQEQLRSIDRRLKNLERQGNKLMSDLDTIIADVTDEETVEASVITLLESVDAQLKAAGNDPAKLAAVRAMIAKDKATMAAAVVANTPAAPPASASAT